MAVTDWFPETMADLHAGRRPARLAEAFDALTRPDGDDVRAAAFLTALAMHDETISALAEAVEALQAKMTRIDSRGRDVVDTCGTGGDHSGTFNISTAAAFVVAGAGMPVVKHGNRAVSSNTGSADVLAELRVPIEAGPAWSQNCLDDFGFAFCFAPHFHPAMKHVAGVRKRLGFRTVFNQVGPMLNPAGAKYQLIGAGSRKQAERIVGMGRPFTVVVHGLDGLDEVTLDAGTLAFSGTELRELSRHDFGLPEVRLADLKVDNARESAMLIERILMDEADLAATHVVVANAATALWAAEKVASPGEGVPLARESIASGRAYKILERLRGSA